MSSVMFDSQKIDLPHFRQGKVREIYSIPYPVQGSEALLFVASDRISAFDVVLPKPIPGKGKVLNMTSVFWFHFFEKDVPHHLISADIDEMVALVPELKSAKSFLDGRSMIVKKSEPLAIECVVRGYLAGSGLKEYNASQSVCGISLPAGLQNSDKLPEMIFTPATKAEVGEHDENIDETRARKIVGDTIFEEAKEKSLYLYKTAAEYALKRGIIICDTKFEFGLKDGKLLLIDEVLTPDSSRFWSKDSYAPGQSQPSFDKQIIRDYLETLDWDKKTPGPELPDEIVKKAQAKYQEIYQLLTDREI